MKLKVEGEDEEAAEAKAMEAKAMEVEAEDVDVQTNLLQTNLLKTQTQKTTLETIPSFFGTAMAEPPEIPPRTIKIGIECKEKVTNQLQEETKRGSFVLETIRVGGRHDRDPTSAANALDRRECLE